LLAVIEFENIKMEQMITKEQIAEAAEQYAEQENSAWTNDYNGFEAGANFVLQLLQQTPCTTLLPIARLYSFAETLAKGDHEWRYSDEDQLWHKDGWVSRTTDELMQLFPERL
jgi:hypothetical protein